MGKKCLVWILAALVFSAAQAENDSVASASDTQSQAQTGSYAALLSKTVRQNIDYLGDKQQNIKTTVYVTIDAQGNIDLKNIKIIEASGDPMWDEAVVNAFKKMKKIPADNGKYLNRKFVFFLQPSEKN